MCTSLTLPLPDGTQLFGRTLDWHEHFDERILHVPQGFSFRNRPHGGLTEPSRHAMLGMGTERDGYPLFADGLNDAGLCMAGLRFAGLAGGTHYLPATATPPEGVICLAPWELIPYVLGFCRTLGEAREALLRVRVVDFPFPLSRGGEIPNAPLHWHVADGRQGGSLVAEAGARGLEVYDAPLGVLANAPAYPEQMAAYERAEREGIFLPSGYDSTTRFIRAAHLREEAMRTFTVESSAGTDPVARFFAMASRLSPEKETVRAATGEGWQSTLYTCCMDGARGLYRYTTADAPERRTVSISDAPEREM